MNNQEYYMVVSVEVMSKNSSDRISLRDQVDIGTLDFSQVSYALEQMHRIMTDLSDALKGKR